MQWARKQTGFTIVELLIVVVVIAILAAITIVAYNGIQNRAKESAAEQALSQVQKKIALWRVDNAEQLPATLASVSGLPVNGTYEYRRFDNNTQYCLAFTDQNLTYRVYSTQSGTYTQGNCTDITAIPSTSTPLAQADRTNRVVSLPSTLSGTPDVTLYAVFDVIDTSSGWEAIAQLRPSVASSSVIQLDMNAAGTDAARYRLDTPSSPNVSAAKFGVRTPGRHIGWVQVNTNGTVRTFNYDGAAPHHTAAFTPGVGWNFTGFGIGGDTTGTQPVFGVVYTQAHDEQTRARVMQWLSDTYSVGATY